MTDKYISLTNSRLFHLHMQIWNLHAPYSAFFPPIALMHNCTRAAPNIQMFYRWFEYPVGFFPVQIFKEKNAASTKKEESFWWICIFLLVISPPSSYIWSPPSKSIIFAMLFVWCRPGYVLCPYLTDVSSFMPSAVASFHVLAKPYSGFNPNNRAVNHRLKSPF